jgi:hypothetical protein
MITVLNELCLAVKAHKGVVLEQAGKFNGDVC